MNQLKPTTESARPQFGAVAYPVVRRQLFQIGVAEFPSGVAQPVLPGWRKPAAHPPVLADCSLVVATDRRPAGVATLLKQLQGLHDPPAEVVVVDGSPDRATDALLAAWARTCDLPFALLYVRSPAGLTRQRNVGIDATTGALVFFLDDDCEPLPGYFTAIRAVFHADPDAAIAAVAGTLINELDQPLPLRWRIRLALRLVPRGEPGRYYPMATSVPRGLARPFMGTRPTDVLPGAAFACRRAALARCRFSHFFDGYCQGDDLEISRRLARDWELRWCGDAHAIHRQAAGSRLTAFVKGRMEVRNRCFIWQRHTPHPGWRCRLQLYTDFLFAGGCDLLHGEWAHGAGVLAGVGVCLVAPPRYQEPPACREYQFALMALTAVKLS